VLPRELVGPEGNTLRACRQEADPLGHPASDTPVREHAPRGVASLAAGPGARQRTTRQGTADTGPTGVGLRRSWCMQHRACSRLPLLNSISPAVRPQGPHQPDDRERPARCRSTWRRWRSPGTGSRPTEATSGTTPGARSCASPVLTPRGCLQDKPGRSSRRPEEPLSTLRCPSCGCENREGAAFCDGCGARRAVPSPLLVGSR